MAKLRLLNKDNEKAHLFVKLEKVTREVELFFEENGVELHRFLLGTRRRRKNAGRYAKRYVPQAAKAAFFLLRRE